MLPGKIAFLLILATFLSVIGALIVANRYRAAMQRLMKSGRNSPSTAAAAPMRTAADAATAQCRSSSTPALAAWRRRDFLPGSGIPPGIKSGPGGLMAPASGPQASPQAEPNEDPQAEAMA